MKDIHRLARLGVRLGDFPNGGFMVHYNSESLLVNNILSNIDGFKELVLCKLNDSFNLGGGILRYQER